MTPRGIRGTGTNGKSGVSCRQYMICLLWLNGRAGCLLCVGRLESEVLLVLSLMAAIEEVEDHIKEPHAMLGLQCVLNCVAC